MSVVYHTTIDEINREELNTFYGGTEEVYDAFAGSFLKAFAYTDGVLTGAVRVISEGLETALLVDYKADDDAVGSGLIELLEQELLNRRVMVYAGRENLDFFESLDYGRCKNAWTYFKEGLDETDFLPRGYKFENEFVQYSQATVNEPKKTEIRYEVGYANASYEAINELLTKAFFGNPHDLAKTTAAFDQSQYTVTAYDGDRLVGIARAVSDNQFYATILNVSVDPEYQGLSIGKKVVLKLSEMIPAKVVVLNTHPGAVGFYNSIREYRRNKYVFEKMIRSEPKEDPHPEWKAAMFTPVGYKFPDEYV